MAKKTSRTRKQINSNVTLTTGKKKSNLIHSIVAKNDGQKELIKTILNNTVTFAYGPAGTGKTHVAVGLAVQRLMRGETSQIVLTRPYVEAGEKLGFLPGNFTDKSAPFMLPMFECMSSYLTNDEINTLGENKNIVILPMAYMRGVTFHDAIVIVDEAQNTTIKQMHLLLTRIGQDTKVVVTGDIHQSDLRYQKNGLLFCLDKLKGIDNIGFCRLGSEHCVREGIVSDIDQRFRDSYAEEWNDGEVRRAIREIGNGDSDDDI